MAITTVLFVVVVRDLWRKPLWLALAAGTFLIVDLAFFSASLTKVTHGGWLPLLVAAGVFTVLSTWRRGREIVTRRRIEEEGPLRGFVEEVRAMTPPIHRAPGTAIFLSVDRDTTPLALRANLEHDHVLHESVVIVLIKTMKVPHVDPAERLVVDDLGYRDDGITHLTARFGFRDHQNVPRTVALANGPDVESRLDVDGASYFLSRITIVPTDAPGMRPWRKRLFIAMSGISGDTSEYFGLPDDRTVTMGSLIEL
jgi:KUP system potassium uptake protein